MKRIAVLLLLAGCNPVARQSDIDDVRERAANVQSVNLTFAEVRSDLDDVRGTAVQNRQSILDLRASVAQQDAELRELQRAYDAHIRWHEARGE